MIVHMPGRASRVWKAASKEAMGTGALSSPSAQPESAQFSVKIRATGRMSAGTSTRKAALLCPRTLPPQSGEASVPVSPPVSRSGKSLLFSSKNQAVSTRPSQLPPRVVTLAPKRRKSSAPPRSFSGIGGSAGIRRGSHSPGLASSPGADATRRRRRRSVGKPARSKYESGVSGTASIASARSPASRAQERLAGISHGPIRQLSARRVRGAPLLFSTSRKTVSRGAPSAPGVAEQPVAVTLTPYTAVCGLSAEAAAASGTSRQRNNRIAVSFFIRVQDYFTLNRISP